MSHLHNLSIVQPNCNSKIGEYHYQGFINIQGSQEVLVLGLLESEIFKGDIRPNLCVCLFVCLFVCPLFNPGKNW